MASGHVNHANRPNTWLPRWCGSKSGKTSLELGFVEGRVDSLVELVDDFGGCVPRGDYAEPRARLIARHKFGNGRNVWQRLRTRRGSHRQRPHFASSDVLKRGGDVEQDLHLSAD